MVKIAKQAKTNRNRGLLGISSQQKRRFWCNQKEKWLMNSSKVEQQGGTGIWESTPRQPRTRNDLNYCRQHHGPNDNHELKVLCRQSSWHNFSKHLRIHNPVSIFPYTNWSTQSPTNLELADAHNQLFIHAADTFSHWPQLSNGGHTHSTWSTVTWALCMPHTVPEVPVCIGPQLGMQAGRKPLPASWQLWGTRTAGSLRHSSCSWYYMWTGVQEHLHPRANPKSVERRHNKILIRTSRAIGWPQEKLGKARSAGGPSWGRLCIVLSKGSQGNVFLKQS